MNKTQTMNYYAYVSTILRTEHNNLVTAVVWSSSNRLIAFGQENGKIIICRIAKREDNSQVYDIRKVCTLIEHKNSITSLSWNFNFNKLISSDKSGKVIVWVELEGKWVPLLINDVSKVPVVSVMSSPNSESVTILYEDGKLICGNITGSQKWRSDLEFLPTAMCWTSHSRSLLTAASNCKLYLLKEHATKIVMFDTKEINVDEKQDMVVGLYESNKKNGSFLILFKLGTAAVYKEFNETNPVILNTENNISCGAWSNDSQSFAIAGEIDEDNCYVKFYSVSGNLVRTVEIKGSKITSICFNHDDSKLAVSVDNTLEIIQKVPNAIWTYFKNTLVYAVPPQNDDEKQSSIVYFNTRTCEKHVKLLSNLTSLASCNDKCALLSMDENNAAIVLTNEQGIPLADNYISFIPKFIAITEKKCIITSDTKLCIWNIESNQTTFFTYMSEITAIAAKNNILFIAFINQRIISMNLDYLTETGNFEIDAIIETIDICSDSTRISAIDTRCFLWFLDIHSGTPKIVDRKKSWSSKWASDSPKLFASLEKQRINIYKEFIPIDTIMSMQSICEFKDLTIFAVNFITIFQDPLNPTASCFTYYQTKPLHDIDLLMKSFIPRLTDEIVSYAASFDCQCALYKVALEALKNQNIELAKKCFMMSKYREGLAFIEYISKFKDKETRKAFALWFAGEKEEAVKMLQTSKKDDLILSIYRDDGDFERELKIAEKRNVGDEIKLSSHGVAHLAFIEGKWQTASLHYGQCGDFHMMLESMFNSDDLIGINRLISQLNTNDALLLEIGKKFLSLGLSTQAADAFLKYGSPQLAADAFAHTNKWKEALDLSKKYPNDIDRKSLLTRFAEHLADNSYVGKAISALINCGLYGEASFYMEREGDVSLKRGQNYLQTKKLYVFSSLMKMKQLKQDHEEIDVNAIWHKAEAVHFLMLTHRLVLSGKYKEALFPASRLLRVYNDVIGKEVSAALLALAGYRSNYLQRCSIGLAHLENSKRLSKKRKERAEALAVKIFIKNEPNDPDEPERIKCQACGADISGFSPKCRCGFALQCSIFSGKPIDDPRRMWRCSQCKHYGFPDEAKGARVCPLCHSKCSPK